MSGFPPDWEAAATSPCPGGPITDAVLGFYLMCDPGSSFVFPQGLLHLLKILLPSLPCVATLLVSQGWSELTLGPWSRWPQVCRRWVCPPAPVTL